MKRTRVSTWLAVVVSLCVAAEPSFAGAIAGKVVFVGTAPPLRKIEVTTDQYVCGAQKDTEDLVLSPRKEIRNAVVWIDNPPPNAAWPTPAPKVAMDQKGCVYAPHVVLVPVGGTVDFLNGDRLLHNIHATPKLNPSLNRTQPKNRTIPIAFEKPEIVQILCDLHPWMEAWVVVAAHPFYALTDPEGKFAFENLPPGEYRLRVWQERLGTASAKVAVGPQAAAQVTIEMRLP